MPGSSQVWVPWTSNGVMASPYLSREVFKDALELMRFDPFTYVPRDFGQGKGDTWYYRVEHDLAGAPLTFAGNVLNELSPIPLDTWSQVRGSVPVQEIGRGSSFTKKAQLLSSWDLDEGTRDKLKRHLARVLDQGAAAAFKSTDAKVNITGAAQCQFSLTGTPTGDSSHQLTSWTVREMVDYLEGVLKAEPYDDAGNYILITTVAGRRALFEDAEIQRAQEHAEPKNRMRGEIGTYYRARIVVTNNSNALSTVGTGSAAESVIFGRKAVAKPVVQAPILLAEERDKGRFLDIAWWALLGYGLTQDYSTHAIANCLHVTST